MNKAELKYLATRPKVKSFLAFSILSANRLLTDKTPPFHKEIIKYFLEEKTPVLAAPRSHSKTTLTALYALWQLFLGKTFTVWIGNTYTNAKKVAKSILESLYSEDLNKIFKIQILSESIDDLEFSIDGRKVSWHSDGITGSLRGIQYLGMRPSVVVLDDVEDDQSVRSKEQREKHEDIYKSSVLSLGDALTQYITIGTILHYDSLLNNLIKQRNGKIYSTNPENPLWPERFGTEALLKKKSEIGSIRYSQEYENRPMLKEDAIFKPEHILFGSMETPRMILSVDPAISKSETADNTGMLLVGMRDGKFYVKEDYSGKYSSVELVDKIIDIWYSKRFEVCLIEEVAYQAAIRQWLLERAGQRNIAIPVRTVTPDKDKVRRALAQQTHFENGRVLFERPFQELQDELLQFPSSARDDRTDALCQSIQYLNNSSYSLMPTAPTIQSAFSKF